MLNTFVVSFKSNLNSLRIISVIIILFIVSSVAATAQEAIINTATLFIAEGKYNDAEKYLDSIIRREPKNITALMMKGNVILNYAIMQAPPVQIIQPDDESIFSKDVVTLKDRVVIVPKATALKVEKLWKQCLAIDSSRLDIRMGMCSLYGLSLMRNELLGYLPLMVRLSKEKGNDFAYTLAQYASLLHERGDREGTYMVYQKIIALYPKVPGLWCPLAAVYFADNDLAHAREAVEKGALAKDPDLSVCREAEDLYTAIGSPDKVMAMLRIRDRDTTFSDYPFYMGLTKYLRRDTSWERDIHVYLDQFHQIPDSNPVFNAALYMTTEDFTSDYDGLISLLNFNLNDFSAKLIAERAITYYPDSILPYMVEIQVLINDKQYPQANALLSTFLKNHPGFNDLQYYYSYSLYCAGDYKAAIGQWGKYVETVKKVKTSRLDHETFLSGPYYFIGQSYLKSGNKVKALEYFNLILAGKDASKFAYMAKVMADKISDEGRRDGGRAGNTKK